jgi:hypothetical protein
VDDADHRCGEQGDVASRQGDKVQKHKDVQDIY